MGGIFWHKHLPELRLLRIRAQSLSSCAESKFEPEFGSEPRANTEFEPGTKLAPAGPKLEPDHGLKPNMC